jgi:polar amino acid transport system permease protein/polar amino acid transport system substrate-binding protein
MDLGKVFIELNPKLLEGLKMTIGVTVLSLILAFVLGLISCFFAMSKNGGLRGISKVYVGLIRGTPLLVQVFYIYFAIPQLIQAMGNEDFRLSVFTAGLVTLTLNAGAYMSEIFRGAINAVSTGQMEAARSLGLKQGQAMRRVILPQAFRICLPSLVNQFIITLKDSSLISVVGFADIMYQAKIYQGRTMESFGTYTWVAIYYLVLVGILTYVAKQVERKVMI